TEASPRPSQIRGFPGEAEPPRLQGLSRCRNPSYGIPAPAEDTEAADREPKDSRFAIRGWWSALEALRRLPGALAGAPGTAHVEGAAGPGGAERARDVNRHRKCHRAVPDRVVDVADVDREPALRAQERAGAAPLAAPPEVERDVADLRVRRVGAR